MVRSLLFLKQEIHSSHHCWEALERLLGSGSSVREGSLSLQLPGARGNVHRVKVELGCQWASVHLQRPRPHHWEGRCPTRGMPLNLPSPRPTVQAIWFGGRILNRLKFSQEENIHHRSPVRRLDIRPGLPALPVHLVSVLQGCTARYLHTSGGQETTPSALPV